MNTRGCTGTMAGKSQEQLPQTVAQFESAWLPTRASQTTSLLEVEIQ